LFDLGGVLIENVGWEHFSRMLPEPLERFAIILGHSQRP
jgi:hypothetical protein